MNPKRHFELIGLVLLIAIFARWQLQPKSETQPIASARPGKLSIYGVSLGMTKAEVEKLLGKPKLEKVDDIYEVFTKAKYKNSEKYAFGEPDILYSSAGRVISVSGASLEWRGGRLRANDDESVVVGFFPNGTVLRSPSYHPYFPGERYSPEHRLTLNLEVDKLFSTAKFCRANLSIPYLYPGRTYYATKSTSDDLLTEAAHLNDHSNRKSLATCEVIGCFYCRKIFKTRPNLPDVGDNPAQCPTCKQDALIGGAATKITASYLQQVHQAFFTANR